METVLALAAAGAKKATAEELTKGLYLPNDVDQIRSIYKEVIPSLKGNEFYRLHSANKLYIKGGFPILDGFRRTAVEFFNADVENVNFANGKEAAALINGFVDNKTEHKIQNLIAPDSLNADVRVIAINALYFKGKWEKPFKGSDTIKRPFYKNEIDFVEVQTMHLTDSFKYYESQKLNAKFLELPYRGGDVVLTIILPNEREGLAAIEGRLNELCDEPKYKEELVQVAIPKFKIESQIEFIPVLQQVLYLIFRHTDVRFLMFCFVVGDKEAV